jgi:hypothetical protein
MNRTSKTENRQNPPDVGIITTLGGFVMEKRKYRKIRELLPIIEAKIAAGQSHSEIEKELGDS